MILPKIRDPRFITVRRGGTLQDSDHHLLALWAADCAEHVLPLFEDMQPHDDRPRRAIELARVWARGEVTMTESRTAAGHANAAARELNGAARHAAFAAAQAAAVAHVAAHIRARAAYAIAAALGSRALRGRVNPLVAGNADGSEQLPDAIRDLVLDDQRLRNDIAGRYSSTALGPGGRSVAWALARESGPQIWPSQRPQSGKIALRGRGQVQDLPYKTAANRKRPEWLPLLPRCPPRCRAEIAERVIVYVQPTGQTV
ncbi:MAG: hypothetical protein R3C44_21170 [Chloroflexota bacterium]